MVFVDVLMFIFVSFR